MLNSTGCLTHFLPNCGTNLIVAVERGGDLDISSFGVELNVVAEPERGGEADNKSALWSTGNEPERGDTKLEEDEDASDLGDVVDREDEEDADI